MIDYRKIPIWWAVCCKESCTKRDGCLRYQAFLQCPREVTVWPMVMPHAETGGECEYFKAYERVQMARGLNHIYDDITDKHTKALIRSALTEYFGSKGSYYRHKDGERLMNPAMQADIIGIIRSFSEGAKVDFDDTFYAYDFTTMSENEFNPDRQEAPQQ